MRGSMPWLFAVMCLAVSPGRGAEGPALEVWAVDPLVKVFPDSMPTAGEALADVARGEHASLQTVVRCPGLAKNLKAEVDALALEGGSPQKALKPRPARFVGYVPVDVGIPTPPADHLRVPPAFFPDPLIEKTEVSLTAGSAQPIWITIPVPIDAAPGLYSGQIRISATVDGKALSAVMRAAWPTIGRTQYDTDVIRFRTARRELLERLSETPGH